MRAAAAAAEGSDAASGEGFGTTRRLVRVAEVGATAADSADGDSGVTPLGIERGGRRQDLLRRGVFRSGLVAQDLVDQLFR